jgi:hypothetical protein
VIPIFPDTDVRDEKSDNEAVDQYDGATGERTLNRCPECGGRTFVSRDKEDEWCMKCLWADGASLQEYRDTFQC